MVINIYDLWGDYVYEKKCERQNKGTWIINNIKICRNLLLTADIIISMESQQRHPVDEGKQRKDLHVGLE